MHPNPPSHIFSENTRVSHLRVIHHKESRFTVWYGKRVANAFSALHHVHKRCVVSLPEIYFKRSKKKLNYLTNIWLITFNCFMIVKRKRCCEIFIYNNQSSSSLMTAWTIHAFILHMIFTCYHYIYHNKHKHFNGNNYFVMDTRLRNTDRSSLFGFDINYMPVCVLLLKSLNSCICCWVITRSSNPVIDNKYIVHVSKNYIT